MAVPALALLELGAHVAEVRDVVPDADWEHARDAVKSMAKPDDLVVFAPRWADPLGRQFFGDLATFEREAWGDVSRFPRAVEVSIRGAHTPDLADWNRTGSQKTGAVTITTFENPAFKPTRTDLVSLLRPEAAQALLQGPEGSPPRLCTWGQGASQSGNLGFGHAIPAAKFSCAGTYVGVTVLEDIEYRPRRCIAAQPPGRGQSLRIVFHGVTFGETLHGHHGIYAESERVGQGPPVSLTFRVGEAGETQLAELWHADGEGWKGFEVPTGALAGKTEDLIVDVASATSNRRHYCFEAITR